MRRMLSLSLGLVLMTSQGSYAQWAVEDVAALGQRTLIWGEEALQWASSLKNQADQIQNEYNLLVGQAKAYETMIRNLTRMPQGLGVFAMVQAYGNKLTSLMNTAGGISYDLNSASRQFTELYGKVDTVAQGDLPTIRQKLLTARLGASQTAVQMQAIQQNSAEIFQRLCGLLDGVNQANGNLDSQQLAAQQQALQLITLQQMQALQATAERLKAQKEAEDVALQRIQIQLMEQFIAPLPEYTGMNGSLPTYRWTDR